jgi:hypothetical protein
MSHNNKLVITIIIKIISEKENSEGTGMTGKWNEML